MGFRKRNLKESERVSFRTIFRYATFLDYVLLAIGILCSAFQGALTASSSLIFTHVVNALTIAEIEAQTPSGIDNYELHQLAMRGVNLYAHIGLGVFSVGFVTMCCWHSLSERQVHRIRQRYFAAVLRQNAAWFDVNETGTLTNRMSDGIERIRDGIGDKVGVMISYFTQCIVGLSIGFYLSWKIALIIILFSPIFFGPLGLVSKLLGMNAPLEMAAYEKAAGIAEEILHGVLTVIAFNAQEHEVKRYESMLKRAMKYGLRKGLLTAIGTGFFVFCLFFGMGLAFWYGVLLLLKDEIELKNLLSSFWAVASAIFAVGQAVPQLGVVISALSAANPIFEIIDRVPEIDSKNGKDIGEVKGKIKFKNVAFSYPSRPETTVLRDISLSIRSGQHVAFVGHSGCGKSSLIQLLLRFYEPNHGEISIDSHPISSLKADSLRAAIGVVSQEPSLFADTIENNVRLGRSWISSDQLEAALRMANTSDFIAILPDGIKTLIGPGGVQLSGGQRQRIAIARALASNPKILVLDEATSALDADSESVVQKTLEKAQSGRTTISIAHRLSTIKNADMIYVFAKGKLVESGVHKELLALNGYYKKLVVAQEIESLDKKRKESVAEFARRESMLKMLSHRMSRVVSAAGEIDSLSSEAARTDPIGGLRSIYSFIKPHRFLLIIATVGAICRGASFPVFSVLYGNLFRTLTRGTDDEKLYYTRQNCLYLTGLGVIGCIAATISGFFFAKAGELLTKHLRTSLIEHILRQDGEYFDEEQHSTGRLLTRLSTDAPNVRAAIDQRLAEVVHAISAMIGGIGVAFYYGLAMAPIGVLTVAGLIGIQIFVAQYLKKRGVKDAERAEEPARLATEAISQYRTIQQLSRQQHFVECFFHGSKGSHRRALVRGAIQSFSYALAISFTFFNFACCYRYGLYLIEQRKLLPNQVFQVIESLNVACMSLLAFATYVPELVRARMSASLIFQMLSKKPKIDSMNEGGEKLSLQGSIRCKELFFSYPNARSRMALSEFSLNIPKGQTVALVGPSGCGKSTALRLLQRFYDPVSGKIQFDGHDLRQLSIRHVRSQMAVVGQEPVLFNMSIKDNIAYGLLEATQSEIEAAARIANAHEFISKLPEGYSTKVGEHGSLLSGGQRQRLSIARAMLRKPKILLLDEATSALDTESEKIVQQALDKARHGRTCIVIAHRLSSVQNADLIVFLRNGKIEEIGTHRSLLRLGGQYAALVQKQMLT